MQRYISEENIEEIDNDVDFMKSEWLDDEKSDDEVKFENINDCNFLNLKI